MILSRSAQLTHQQLRNRRVLGCCRWDRAKLVLVPVIEGKRWHQSTECGGRTLIDMEEKFSVSITGTSRTRPRLL